VQALMLMLLQLLVMVLHPVAGTAALAPVLRHNSNSHLVTGHAGLALHLRGLQQGQMHEVLLVVMAIQLLWRPS
jgi:hypothetical protein